MTNIKISTINVFIHEAYLDSKLGFTLHTKRVKNLVDAKFATGIFLKKKEKELI